VFGPSGSTAQPAADTLRAKQRGRDHA
jgi:hypothetical protein